MIPLYKPYMPEELPLLNEILQSGALSYGKWGKLFENKLSDYIGTKQIITTNSYNSAVQICIAALGLEFGDEVIASPMSCLASNQPFAFAGLKLKWVDIDPKTGTICPESLVKVITSKTKAIIHNHFAGYVGNIEAVNNIAREKGIFIIDDGIEAFGSEYDKKKIGNVGSDATIFSFQTVRLPNTIDGGAVAFKLKEHYEKALLIRDYGIDRTLFRDSLNEISPLCDIKIPSIGATMSEINSYIGYVQMDKIESLFNLQKINANLWKSYFDDKKYEIETVSLNHNTTPNYWVFGLLVQDKIKNIKSFREKGLYASGVHLSNTNYSVFGKKINLPGVDEFNGKFIAIPSGWWVNSIQQIKLDAK